MKQTLRLATVLLMLLSAMPRLVAQTGSDIDRGTVDNKFFWGVSFEGSSWIESNPEVLWRIGTEFLFPVNDRLSLGAYAGCCFLVPDVGIMGGWLFDNNSRLLLGAGYSYAYDTPMVRWAFKTPSPFYVSGSIGADLGDGVYNVSLGVGYALFGGRRR